MPPRPSHHLPAHRQPLEAFIEEHKPLLRGWSHALAAIAAVIITIALVAATYGDVARCIAVVIFGLSMIALYVVSAVYNLGSWSQRMDRVLQTIDHANIFVYIAGTYTPLCVTLLHGTVRVLLLTVVWTIALVGVVVSVFTLRLPRWLTTVLYILMGWVAVLAMPSLVRQLPPAALGLMLLGGVLYTLGAVVFIFRRPDPFPRIFGFHEIFHLFVIAGSAAFVLLIWGWVVA